MEVSVLDKQTIQCVMTEKEIADYGMDKHTIYQNDARTADFFRQVMHRAQQETGFVKKGKSVAVHAAFLADESLEITFSVDTGRMDAAQEGAELETAGRGSFQPAAAMPGTSWQESADPMRGLETILLKSAKLDTMADFCRRAHFRKNTDLYAGLGDYFLLADVKGYQVHDAAALLFLADEYMDGAYGKKSMAAYIKEHGKCMIKGNAAEVLSSL